MGLSQKRNKKNTKVQLIICWFGGNVTLHDKGTTAECGAMHTLVSPSVLSGMLMVVVCVGNRRQAKENAHE